MDGIIRLLYSFKFTVFGIEIDSGNLIGTIEKLTNFSSVKGINIWSIGKTVNDVIDDIKNGNSKEIIRDIKTAVKTGDTIIVSVVVLTISTISLIIIVKRKSKK